MKRYAFWSVVLCLPLSPAMAGGEDYLPAGLRAEVEALKTTVREGVEPASAEALIGRGQVAWRWLNAWAVNGGYVPPEAPQIIARLPMAAVADGPARTHRALRQANDRLAAVVRELAFVDEHPEGLGRASGIGDETFEAGSLATIVQRYVVGRRAMEPGSILVAAQHRLTPGSLQATDAHAPNFVTARVVRGHAQLRPGAVERVGMHGGFGIGPVPTAAFEVASGSLIRGDVVEITYGDTSGGSPGLRMPTFSNEAFPLPLYVRFAGDPLDYAIPQTYFQVSGGVLDGLHAFVPSVLEPDERFDLTIRGEDRYLNRAQGAMPSWRVYVGDELVRQVPAGGGSLQSIPLPGFGRPGVYRLRVESASGEFTADANPILVESAPGRRIYWGDTHGHSGMAEGQGTSDEFFRFGRDDARLDFLVHSEHDIWMDDHEWEEIRRNTIAYYEPGRFVTFLGYEWTVPAAWGGHHNVLFRTPERRDRVPRQTHPHQRDLYRGLRERYEASDVLVIPHAHQPGAWRTTDAGLERLVEITSLHGVFEWYGEMFLREQHRVGFVGSTDDHAAHPGHRVKNGGRGGLAAVRATTATRDALFDAMRRLDTYATTGVRAIMDFSVNDAGMGRTVGALDGHQTIAARVIGTEGIDHIDLVRDGELIKRWDLSIPSPPQPNGGAELLEIRYASPSSPPGMQHVVPRGPRKWRSKLTLTGAGIVDYDAPGFLDVAAQSLSVTPGPNGAAEIRTVTRGSGSRAFLHLDCAGNCEAARLAVQVAGPETFEMSVADALRGRTLELVDGEWRDTIRLRRVSADPIMEYALRYEDPVPVEETSWYYLRAVQRDDAEVWSSPVWVIPNDKPAP